MTDEQVAKTYTRLVLQGKLRSAVRFVDPEEIDIKSGLPVRDVLESKHPQAVSPPIEELEPYEVVPELPTLDITGDVVEVVAKKMSGAAGPGGTDAVALQHWLLRFGVASSFLRDACARFARWLANKSLRGPRTEP